MSETSPNELDDELAAALARHAREREAAQVQARAPEWEAVTRGELGVEEAVERRREAGDEAEQLERAADYFRPFDDEERSALVDGLLAGLDASEDDTPGEDALGEVVPLKQPEPEAEPESKPHDPGSSGFWWIPGGMLVAAAAAILLWWLWPPSQEIRDLDGDDPIVATREPLPSYVLETDGGLQQLRGDTEGSPEVAGRHRYRRDTAFEWVLRPEVEFSEEVALRGFAFVDGSNAGLPLRLDEMVKIADSGAIRIAGEIAQLDLEPGRYTIALAVGRPDALPTEAAALVEPSGEGSWTVRRVDILIED
jgi:hypothetical protein